MTGRVNQVDQEIGTIRLLALDVLGVITIGESGVQGDGSRLDRDATWFMSAPCHHMFLALETVVGTYAPAHRHEYRWHEHHQPFR